MGGPALIINPGDGILIADFFGFLLSLPIALFLAFWMSAVKRRWIVVLGALIGAFIAFLIIFGWVGTLIYDTDLPNAQPAAVFFGSLLFCSAARLVGGILLDLIVARATRREYRRSAPAHS